MITNSQYEHPWSKIAKYSETEFVRMLIKRATSKNVKLEQELVDEITLGAKDIFDKNKRHISDESTQFHFMLMSYVIASVQAIESVYDGNIAKKIVEEAFVGVGSFWVIWSFKIGLFLSKNKFSYIIENCGYGVKTHYGSSFDIEVETDNKSYLNTKVLKCGFHEFFINNQRPELTSILCERDNLWAKLLRNSRYIDYKRETTISLGDNSCNFCFKNKKAEL